MRSKLFLTMLLTVVFANPLHGQEAPKDNSPLSPNEIREGILRIEQGILAAQEVSLLKKSIADRDALTERERAIAIKELDLETKRADLETQRAETEKTRGDFYENAFKTVTKKTTFGCHVARIFTLGLAKCGR